MRFIQKVVDFANIALYTYSIVKLLISHKGGRQLKDIIIHKKIIDLSFIKKLRIENHLSQADLASILGLNNHDKYARRENGEYKFQASEIQMLAELYHLPMEKFFTYSVR